MKTLQSDQCVSDTYSDKTFCVLRTHIFIHWDVIENSPPLELSMAMHANWLTEMEHNKQCVLYMTDTESWTAILGSTQIDEHKSILIQPKLPCFHYISAIRNPGLTAKLVRQHSCSMMTSSNGNIFRVTGHLCGEFTGLRWIPHTKASDAELWCFLWSAPEWVVELTLVRLMIRDDIMPIMTSQQWLFSAHRNTHWTNFSEMLVKFERFSFMKMHLKLLLQDDRIFVLTSICSVRLIEIYDQCHKISHNIS